MKNVLLKRVRFPPITTPKVETELLLIINNEFIHEIAALVGPAVIALIINNN